MCCWRRGRWSIAGVVYFPASIHLAVAAHADQDDLLIAQLKLDGDAILKVDGHGVQARQPGL
jgi:hypothetical protein